MLILESVSTSFYMIFTKLMWCENFQKIVLKGISFELTIIYTSNTIKLYIYTLNNIRTWAFPNFTGLGLRLGSGASTRMAAVPWCRVITEACHRPGSGACAAGFITRRPTRPGPKV